MSEREWMQEEETLAAERGRSPSGAASVGGDAGPVPEVPAGVCPPTVSPAGPDHGSGGEDSTPERPDTPAADVFPQEPFQEPLRTPCLSGQPKGPRLVKPAESKRESLSAEQRLLILDTWQRSGLPGGDFATLVGVSKHTLYAWKKKFHEQGPAGLMDQPRGGPKGSRLPELTKRTILLLKQSNPDWGCQRTSDPQARGTNARSSSIPARLRIVDMETPKASVSSLLRTT